MSTVSRRMREERRKGAATKGEEKLAEAAKATLQAEGDVLSPEEQEALGETPDGEEEDDTDGVLLAEPGTEPPSWALVPEKDFKFPPGKQVYFLRIPGEWTDKPGSGDRQCILWNLTMADEDLALTRARGSHLRVNRELSMAMVRAIDGVRADWTSGKASSAGNVRTWFNDIGPRGRLLVQNVYLRTHQVDTEQKRRFFDDCFALVTFP